jgi:hypothetical protein
MECLKNGALAPFFLADAVFASVRDVRLYK